MIIDAHTHIHPNPLGFGPNRDASPEALAEGLREAGIDRAVVLAIEPDMSNEYVAAECAKHPEFIGFVSLNPKTPETARPLLEQYVGSGRMHGVKLHGRRQGFGNEHLPGLISVVEQAAEFDVPVLIDAFPYGDTFFRIQEVRMINDVAAAVPKARIILAHCGGVTCIDALMAVRANANIVVDVSFTPVWFAGSSVYTDLVFVLKKIGPHRILHGSDAPDVKPLRALEETHSLIRQCGFSESDAALILGANAERVLQRTSQP